MDTIHATERESLVEQTDRRLRPWKLAVAIMAVIALGFAGWVSYLLFAPGDTDVAADVQTVIDDYRDAWNNYDADGFRGLVTSGYRFYDGPSATPLDVDETAAMIGTSLPAIDWSVEQIGEPQMVGGATRVTVAAANQTSMGEGFSLFTLVKQDGAWKLAQHVFIGG